MRIQPRSVPRPCCSEPGRRIRVWWSEHEFADPSSTLPQATGRLRKTIVGRVDARVQRAVAQAPVGWRLCTINPGVKWKNAVLTYGFWAFGQPVQYVSLVGRRW